MQSKAEKRWYLVQCKPKQDFRALEHLQHQGYECLLPTHQIERLRNGQWVRQEEALFPGYLFIELDTSRDNWMPIRSTRGVNQIVRFGPNPLPVSSNIIDRLRYQEIPRKQELQPGDKVFINGQSATVLKLFSSPKMERKESYSFLNFYSENFRLASRLIKWIELLNK